MKAFLTVPLDAPTRDVEQPEPNAGEVLSARFQLTSATVTLLVIAGAALALAGWALGVPALRHPAPGAGALSPLAAAALLSTGLALWIYRSDARGRLHNGLPYVTGGAALLAVIGLVTHFSGWPLALDSLARDRSALGEAIEAMTPATAVGVLMVNAALLVADTPGYGPIAQALVSATAVLATLNAIGYGFRLSTTYGVAATTAMGIHSSVSLLLTCLGFVFARPQHDLMKIVVDPNAGGFVSRKLIPVVFVVPLLLAWLSWRGVNAGWYAPGFAMALFVTLTTHALGYAVIAGSRMMRGFDDRRLDAEAQRLQGEERLRRAVTDAPVPIIIHDESQQILHMSQGWSAISGYSIADTPTLAQWMARAQPEGVFVLKAHLEQLANATTTLHAGETPVRTKAGVPRVWELSSTPLSDRHLVRRSYVTMAVDVTERKQAEADLRQLNEGLEGIVAKRTDELTRANDALKRQSDQLAEQGTLLDIVRDGILVRDLYGTLVYWNRGAADLYEWTAGETLGRVSHQLLHTEYPRPLADIERDVLATGYWEGEVVQTTKQGRRVPVETRWTLTRTERGTPQGVLEVHRDITSRKEAERALSTKAEALARSNQELEQFAYIASHDLQEPLRMVSNYTELLGRRYRDRLDDDANDFIGFAVDGARRMQALIHDLLEYARVGTRAKDPVATPADRLIADAVANLSSAIAESHAELKVGELPELICDASQLRQVFQNLIGNAIKFRRPDTAPIITISAAHSQGEWTLSVGDNGIGIDPRFFERIFQMFQRLHGRDQYAGTGIGLALCKKIVERHGGRISVTSAPDAGSTFHVTLPDVPPAA